MALNLKRKRETEASSRKTRKIEDEGDLGLAAEDEVMVDSGKEAEEMDAPMDVSEGDEEEWGGVTDADSGVPLLSREDRTGVKPKKPPTGEELRTIKDAADLFRSSSFKLQIDALLPNVRPKASRLPPLDRFLLSIHTFLMNLPSIPAQHPLEASRKLLRKSVSVPYALPLPAEETNWKVAFEKPSDITLVGSWANKVSVKSKDGFKFGVDLALEMPNSLFQEKDYLNGRFFHKRAFYLATIAAAIQASKSGLNIEASYDSLHGDPRLTKLVLVPKKDESQNDFSKLNAQVCIIPVLSLTSPIPLHRLSPAHSNIRVSVVNTLNVDTKTANPPTPMYNTALLHTLTPKPYLLATYALKQGIPAFADALTLLRVWANQRGYSEGSRMCVSGFEGRGPWWGAVLALLINGEEFQDGVKAKKRKPLGKGLSSYQLFKAALDFLAKHDFEKEPVFVRSQDVGQRFPPAEYREGHAAVLVDSVSLVNLLAGVPLGSLEMLRYDAIQTTETLNSTSISGDPFTEVFLKEHRDLPTRFDTVLRVDLSSAQIRKFSVETTVDLGSAALALMASLNSFIRLGLGDRVRAATILHPSTSCRPLTQAHPSYPDVIYVGLIHNPQQAFRLVDHGPTADEQDQSLIERFRELWGDKAELRRFKDGRILESVIWEVKNADERAHVPGKVVRHILKRHFGLQEGAVQTWQTSFDSVLRLPESISSVYLGSGVPAGFKAAISAYDNLVKAIKTLDDDLPLSLLNVSPTSELLRYTNVFSPVPLPVSIADILPPNARYLSPIDIVLEFEKSSKWPDDLKAIQKIKLAFFERLASVLMESKEDLKATVIIGDGVSTSEILDQSSLEIVTPEGWAFSARIWHEREATLLDRIIDGSDKLLPHIVPKTKDINKGKEYHDAVEAKAVYTRRFIHAPRHHRAIAALCHHYSAYAGTVRLVKRWLASHWLLDGHISEEVVEIICAHFFVKPGRQVGIDIELDESAQHIVPSSKERGFAAVVHFLKEWKWEEGLLVPLYGLTEAPAVTGSKASTSGVWSISTELDKDGHIWTSHGPDAVVAHRVQALAKATWTFLQGMEHGNLNVQSLFIHPTDDYSFVIQLEPSALTRYCHNVIVDSALLSKRGKYANRLNEGSAVLPGFDPARLFFKDLQRMYADTLKIFFDPLGGDRIGAVWDPTLKQPRPFRVLSGFSSILIKKDNEKAKDKALVVLNEKAVLNEIERCGKGLVKTIALRV
ncbi:Nrap protein [Crucibulum laeve]|uniref:U3 small nucleolar RNA-associated protein 22 n=1 Tax=Crucibulum laeve TaxID=68775 RepID=A0A5C3LFS0_9AGAR|nr:Nrap protein [Crucibulum laeve]